MPNQMNRTDRNKEKYYITSERLSLSNRKILNSTMENHLSKAQIYMNYFQIHQVINS